MDEKKLWRLLKTLEELSDDELECLGYQRIREIPQKNEAQEVYDSVSENQEGKPQEMTLYITDVLKKCGIPSHLLGFEYLRYAILLCLEDASLLNSIVNGLYPAISKKYNTKSYRVDRAIRHAIEVSTNHADYEFITEIFSYTIDANRGKATNNEFIATITEYIRSTAISDDASQKDVITISNILKRCGIKPKALGFKYLICAINFYLKEDAPSTPIFITKDVYPYVAEKFNTITTRVVRSISHAIRNSMTCGDRDFLKKIFGKTLYYTNKAPTNNQFIATIVDYIKLGGTA